MEPNSDEPERVLRWPDRARPKPGDDAGSEGRDCKRRSTLSRSCQRERLYSFRPPHESGARTIGDAGKAVPNLQRFLEDRVGPVKIFQVMTGRRRSKQVRTDLWQTMRRHFDPARCSYASRLYPAAYAADARCIGHHIVAGPGYVRLAGGAGQGKMGAA